MRTIAKLFGRSPFGPIRSHMECVGRCVDKMAELLRAFEDGNWEQVEPLAEEVSQLEHQADEIKNDIRVDLPKSLFLPVDRSSLLEVLTIQDDLADKAENVAVLFTLKRFVMLPMLHETFSRFRDANLEAFRGAQQVILELGELLESGFGGGEAHRVREMAQGVALKEHEVDLIQRELMRSLYAHEQELSHGDLGLWIQLVKELAGLSNHSEKLANRILTMLEVK